MSVSLGFCPEDSQSVFFFSTQYPITAQQMKVNRILGFGTPQYLPVALHEDLSAEKASEPGTPASGGQVASQTE